MTLRTGRDLNQRFQGEKSLYISQGYRFKRKFEIKAKKISA